MLRILKNKTYAALFSAQIIALLGTGLLTVALGFLAFDLTGDQAGAVLGTAYAIKMVAYVGLAPLANLLAERLPRKTVLVGADLIRAAVALFLPFIDALWQVYVLIFVLQAASATFTPAFQATIPDVLPDEEDYTNALSLSRLAYDIENLVSPMLAGALLTVMSYHWLFSGTALGFLGSTALVLVATIPPLVVRAKKQGFTERLTWGTRLYLATPRLRGLLSFNLAAAASSAFVIVNTVVIVKSEFGADDRSVALALGAYGAGSMAAALALPRLLGNTGDRPVMLGATVALTTVMIGQALYSLTIGLLPWPVFLVVWAAMGFFYTSILTPSGRLLRKSAHPEDRPAVFAAQFALSHACWLVTYPVAGWIGSFYGLPIAMLVLSALALTGLIVGNVIWPAEDPKILTHSHPELPADHPHLKKHGAKGKRHRHAFVIDNEHQVWPTHG